MQNYDFSMKQPNILSYFYETISILQIKHIDTYQYQCDTYQGSLGDFLLQHDIGEQRHKDIPQGFQYRHILQLHPLAHGSDVDEQGTEEDGIRHDDPPVEHRAQKAPMLPVRTLLQQQLAASRQENASYHQKIKQSYFFHAKTTKPKMMMTAPRTLWRVMVSENIP